MTNALRSSEWGRENWRAILAMGADRGVAVYAVSLQCERAEHARRIASEDRRHLLKLTNIDAVPADWTELNEDGATDVLHLDTTGLKSRDSAVIIATWLAGQQKLG